MNKFSSDIARYRANGSGGMELWLNPAVWAIGCYRLGNWLNVARPLWPIRIPVKLVSFVGNKFCEVKARIHIRANNWCAIVPDGVLIQRLQIFRTGRVKQVPTALTFI